MHIVHFHKISFNIINFYKSLLNFCLVLRARSNRCAKAVLSMVCSHPEAGRSTEICTAPGFGMATHPEAGRSTEHYHTKQVTYRLVPTCLFCGRAWDGNLYQTEAEHVTWAEAVRRTGRTHPKPIRMLWSRERRVISIWTTICLTAWKIVNRLNKSVWLHNLCHWSLTFQNKVTFLYLIDWFLTVYLCCKG